MTIDGQKKKKKKQVIEWNHSHLLDLATLTCWNETKTNTINNTLHAENQKESIRAVHLLVH